MKHSVKLFLTSFLASMFLIGCQKAEDLMVHQSGIASVLALSSTTVAPPPADSNKVALTLTWTYPNHATNPNNIKYVVEMDSVGKNFSNPLTKTVIGGLSTTYTAKELNTFMVNRGYAFNAPVSMETRVTSSYANNNEQIASNVMAFRFTPYKVPPKIALPTTGKLFIVGAATQGGWNNPVPAPSQEFSRLDETTFVGIFNLNGGQEYLLLPQNGSWDNKYSVADKSKPGLSAGGDFGYNLNDNFPGPATSGMYKIVMDFQSGKFTVTSYSGTLPENLFIVGDATPGGWNNPVPTPSQQFTRLNSVEFELTLNMVSGKEFLLLPVNGDWSNKYSVANKSLPNLWQGGEFGYNLPDNFPGPPTDGNHKISVNFATGMFKVTKL